MPPPPPTAQRRPDPDQLLARVQQAAEDARRGKLRIFFGASAGVGKTYAMLESAQAARAAGTDIVVGYVEPHGRIETERLLECLERLPTVAVRLRGIVRQEFDLDAALSRHPVVLIVDELAHTNLVDGEPAPRHEKRWQDVEELLNAGISVWTTVNVQHLESLNDVVASVTGVRQQETVPDHAFESADEVELIDLPPDDLLGRLRAGKVYTADQATTAVQRFFRKENLTALREIALRKTADRVDAAMRAFEAGDEAMRPWLARDRLIVAPGPDAQAEQLVRAGKRLADALDAEWIVVYVETPPLLKLSEPQRNRRVNVLRLAESLGAETVTLDGPSAAEVILEYARTRKATRIIVGAPKRRGFKALFKPSTVTELVRRAGPIDVIAIGPGGSGTPVRRSMPTRATRVAQAPPKTDIPWARYAAACATTLITTAIAWLMYPYFELANLVMVYLLGAAVAGLRFGRGPAILASVLNVAAFDFFFVPPRFAFAVTDFQYLVTFAVMLVVAFAIASLTANVRQQTRIAGHRERRTAALYAMSRELSQTRGVASMAAVAVRHVEDVFASRALVLVPGADGRLHYPRSPESQAVPWRADMSVAQWVYHHNEPAGLGTDTLAGAKALYLPIRGSKVTFGVLAVEPTNPRRILLPEQRHLLETFAGQLGLGLERALLAEESEAARVAAESESVRRRLLASIAHDLRRPLEKIKDASTTLAEDAGLEPDRRVELARTIEAHADQLVEVVRNSLELVRLEVGAVALRVEPHAIGPIVTAVVERLRDALARHTVDVRLAPDLPAVRVDRQLIEEVLDNLLKNAARYTPPGSVVTISGHADGDWVHLRVEDNGPGLPDGDPALLFQPFERGESATVGAGLGLAICKTIVAAHGGSISAHTRPAGGAAFDVSLPSGASDEFEARARAG